MTTTEDATPSTSFLSIPSRISRSASRESFATDASLMSLSSFTSEIGNRPHRALLEEGTDAEKDSPEIIRYKEDILEKMLESHTLAIPKLVIGTRSRQGSNASRSGKKREEPCPHGTPLLTDSDEELLKACAEENPRNRGSLFKSFSTTDLIGYLPDTVVLKHCVSQAWIPNDYVQVVHCRKKHLEEIQRMNPDDILQPDILLCRNSQFARYSRISSDKQSHDATVGSDSSSEQRKATSEENIPILSGRGHASGPFLKRIKISREIGRKLRDDLMKKISKHKEKLLPKLDLEKDKGRPVTKLERNFMIFHWLQSLDEDTFDDS